MFTVDRLKRYVDDGKLTVDTLDDLVLLNYTHKVQYKKLWDEVTTKCRGLILRLDKPWPDGTRVVETVALPFEKFFNWGEVTHEGQPVEVTEKEDGWLGTLFRYQGGYRIATRGKFDSPGAQWATEYLKRYDLSALPENYTLLFEIISPITQVVVNYQGWEDLILIGCRDRWSGQDFLSPFVRDLAGKLGFSVPGWYSGPTTVQDFLQQAKTLGASREGWVLRYSDGVRIKVKGKKYLEVAAFMEHVSPKDILLHLREDDIDQFIADLPPRVADMAVSWHGKLKRQGEELFRRVCQAMDTAPIGGPRKGFAEWAKSLSGAEQGVAFMIFDGRDPMPLIWKLMYQGKVDWSIE